ncbi:uncharacterized protein EI97DRAFT_462986 [Westerdykella ornata]|uniref:Uncharacterized protein n=1 Tax=Westerdykella ornata TaxID=318751 RepID=A0A6A6J518_WESOR|nr:uncharacterized protein EI97DRAFT_462986 [Westerdykella ornata]KAF2271277.1 hypothetical protein EI97DRAFT_462986 [Westerdykella ornata]
MYITRDSTSDQLPEPAQQPFRGIYDGVHDMYGPGAFVAWIITGYCVAAQYFSPMEGPLYWNIDKDLAIFLLYPVVAAGQLIYKSSRYSGPRTDFCASTYSQGPSKPGVAAIWACTNVCLTATSMNACLLVLLRKSRIRFICVLAAYLWLLASLLYAWRPCLSFKDMVCWSILIMAWPLLSALGPAALPLAVFILPYGIRDTWYFVSNHHFSGLDHLNYKDYVTVFVLALLGICGPLFGALFMAFLGVGALGCLLLMIPQTNHKIDDFGQIMTLMAAVVNAVFVVRTLFKEYGRVWLGYLLERERYWTESRVQADRIERP